MDKYRIDSHKLIYHVRRVSDWLEGGRVYPMYVEIAPCGSCNHRCSYCALDFMGYKPRYLEEGMLKQRISEMADLGIKSIMFAGEGEPLLHKDIAGIINHTKDAGIDVALTTNGVLLDKGLIDIALGSITWIKVSINAANEETYRKIHRSVPGDFSRVIKNMTYAARLKKKKSYKCTLGMQLLLLPENAAEVMQLAEKAKSIGMDYLVVKPYSQHPFSRTTMYKNIKYNKFMYLAEKLQSLKSNRFEVIFRLNTMKKWDEVSRNYKHCYAHTFWSYIDAAGNLWGCSAYLGDKRFIYGNIYKDTFKRIWEGPKRAGICAMIEKKLDTDKCRVNCRMDEVNRYLWDLKYPLEHVNFI